MKTNIFISCIICLIALCLSLTACQKKWSETQNGTIMIVNNDGIQTLGYSTTSGIKLIESDGFAFKDLNKNGRLDIYEDWRRPVDERAKDLASKMTVEQIGGLMLYSSHQSIPAMSGVGPATGDVTYNGKPFSESGARSSDPSDQQIKFIKEEHLRHVLITTVDLPEVAAQWNNNIQALVEGLDLGIPVNTSSDPRHETNSSAIYNAGAGGEISMWPGSLGMAATFDPSIVKQFGEIASQEYRALGIATALSPQIDLATEPRWGRVAGTFGEDPQLSADMARAYVDAFQTSEGDKEIKDGWGYNSVNVMAKHWPSGGPTEGGRDPHHVYGKFAVYPGNNFADQIKPFTEGAFKLDGATKSASAVMSFYTISYGVDQKYHENVANSYSKYIIDDLLRDQYGFDGVVCTDWDVSKAETTIDDMRTGKCFGVEHLTEVERHYRIIMSGVDQFGGLDDAGPVIEAYKKGVEEIGEAAIRVRFEQSAVRLLKNIFRVGLFENPYLDTEDSKKVVGNAEFMAAGYEAQLKSIIMLKNQNNVLPLKKETKVYVPKKARQGPGGFGGFGGFGGPGGTGGPGGAEAKPDYPVSIDLLNKYFTVTDNPDEADCAIVFISGPSGGSGYSTEDVKNGGTGYVPISLQYNEYTAVYARDPSIAGGDPLENFTNRTFKGKTVTASNSSELDLALNTRKLMKGKPVIVSVALSTPMVFAEFEKDVDAIVASYGVQDQALLDIISGNSEPSGLLPMQMPADMKTVEEQFEDVPHDMRCHVDSVGNTYDFGFGMNWKGVINDERTAKYKG